MSRVTPLFRPLLAGCLLTALAACGSNFGFPGVYRINVEQGNVVTEEMVEQLRPGLNRRQVRYIMGTPADRRRLPREPLGLPLPAAQRQRIALGNTVNAVV